MLEDAWISKISLTYSEWFAIPVVKSVLFEVQIEYGSKSRRLIIVGCVLSGVEEILRSRGFSGCYNMMRPGVGRASTLVHIS